jgi:hypothetical protein
MAPARGEAKTIGRSVFHAKGRDAFDTAAADVGAICRRTTEPAL